MRTEYEYSIDTCRTSEVPFIITTRISRITFSPDPSRRNEIRMARVSVGGSSTSRNQKEATIELVKVLIAYFGPQACCNLQPSRWNEVKEKGDRGTLKIGGGLTLISGCRYVKPIIPSDKDLKVNVDGDADILLQYYEASRSENPKDRFLQMFKIVEYLSGPKPFRRGVTKHVMMGISGGLWDIPPSTLQRIKSIGSLKTISSKQKLASVLCGIRGRCAHFRPRYGFLPLDAAGNTTVIEALPVLEEIVRFSLEINPKTKEP